MNIKHAIFASSLLGLLACDIAANAQITIDLSPIDTQVSSAGGTVTYSATLTNLYNFDVVLNGLFDTTDAPLQFDATRFLDTFVFPTDPNGDPMPQPILKAAGDINGGDTVTGSLFDITVPAGTLDGAYGSSFTINGGPTGFDFDILGAANLTVRVNSAVPEPGAGTLMGASAVGFLIWKRRRRAA